MGLKFSTQDVVRILGNIYHDFFAATKLTLAEISQSL